MSFHIRQFVSRNFLKSEVWFDWLISWRYRCLRLEAAGRWSSWARCIQLPELPVQGCGSWRTGGRVSGVWSGGTLMQNVPRIRQNTPLQAKKIVFPPQTPSPVDLAPRPKQSHLDPRLRPAEFMPNFRLGPCSRTDGRWSELLSGP